jgi:ketosteroid isomerase-like protein
MGGGSGSSGQVRQQDVETVRAGYERWNKGDLAGLYDLFAENITYQNAPEWPGQRVYEGAASVTSFLDDEVARIIELRPVTIVRTDRIGDEILIELHTRTHGFLSGVEMEDLTVFHLAQVDDGKVTRVRVYLTEDQALRAAKTGEG